MSTPEEDEQLRFLHAQGLTDHEIGDIMGYSCAAIFARRKKLGLPSNRLIWEERTFGARRALKLKCHAEGMSDAEAAKVCGMKERAYSEWRNREHLPKNKDLRRKKEKWRIT